MYTYSPTYYLYTYRPGGITTNIAPPHLQHGRRRSPAGSMVTAPQAWQLGAARNPKVSRRLGWEAPRRKACLHVEPQNLLVDLVTLRVFSQYWQVLDIVAVTLSP
jgi:hypothetical protein